jgi:hypothetical protein
LLECSDHQRICYVRTKLTTQFDRNHIRFAPPWGSWIISDISGHFILGDARFSAGNVFGNASTTGNRISDPSLTLGQ